MKNKNTAVYINRCQSYETGPLTKVIGAGFDCIAKDIDFNKRKVLVKPNILFDAPVNKAVTTHPILIGVVITELMQRGAEVWVGDSPGFQGPGYFGRKSGLRRIVKENGARWVDFKAGKKSLKAPCGKLVHEFNVAEAALQADMIVNVPKMKTHQLMLLTGAVKNMFGLIPGLGKSRFHVTYPEPKELAEMLLDLYQSRPPILTVMDGIIAMEGPGPGSGYPKETGLVLMSKDGPALDVIVALLMGYKPYEVPVNKAARARGLVPKDPEQIPIIGMQLSQAVLKDFVQVTKQSKASFFRDIIGSRLFRYLGLRGRAKPVFLTADEGPCILCGKCTVICASGALHVDGKLKQVVLDEKKCIRCYCCHEICPVDAIGIEK